MAHVVSVNVGRIVEADWAGSLRRTAIDKRPVQGRVPVRDDAVGEDQQADRRGHGGPDKAGYAYAVEDARWWEAQLDRPLPPGSFGENLTTEELDVTGAVIGERWRIGTAIFEVSEPRIPCRTFAGFWGMPDLVRRFMGAGRPGAYLRIAAPGEIGAGDAVEVLSRPRHGVTVGTVYRARSGERSLVPALLDVPELAPAWRDWAGQILGESAPA